MFPLGEKRYSKGENISLVGLSSTETYTISLPVVISESTTQKKT
jgi:hypothetical protein